MNSPTPAVWAPPPAPAAMKAWRRLRVIALWTFLIGYAIDVVYILGSAANSVNQLKAQGNPFANLVWQTVPAALIVDGFFWAIVTALVLVGVIVKRTLKHQTYRW